MTKRLHKALSILNVYLSGLHEVRTPEKGSLTTSPSYPGINGILPNYWKTEQVKILKTDITKYHKQKLYWLYYLLLCWQAKDPISKWTRGLESAPWISDQGTGKNRGNLPTRHANDI